MYVCVCVHDEMLQGAAREALLSNWRTWYVYVCICEHVIAALYMHVCMRVCVFKPNVNVSCSVVALESESGSRIRHEQH